MLLLLATAIIGGAIGIAVWYSLGLPFVALGAIVGTLAGIGLAGIWLTHRGDNPLDEQCGVAPQQQAGDSPQKNTPSNDGFGQAHYHPKL